MQFMITTEQALTGLNIVESEPSRLNAVVFSRLCGHQLCMLKCSFDVYAEINSFINTI